MTSRPGPDAVRRELRFDAAGVPADAGAPFRFALDFDGDDRWPDVPYDTSLPAARHGADARARIAGVLGAAARTMAERVPAARRLVDEQLQRVLLRAQADGPGGSASHRAHVGRCLLTNLDRPAAATLVAIEALTHEATHQLLYRTEAEGGLFCDLAPLPTVRSPWSGARLPLHSLVHAAFVWSALLALWTRLALAPADASEAAHARSRVAHCLFGFAFLEDLLASPAFPATGVAPPVLEALRSMASEARRAAREAEPGATLRQVAAAREAAGWPAGRAARRAIG
jgi:HEXXH motif-containing protein